MLGAALDMLRLRDVVAALPFEACVSHAALCDALGVILREWHWAVRQNVCAVVGQSSQGRVDFVVYSPMSIALEIDHRTPRRKSLAKLASFVGSRVIILRCPSLPVFPLKGYNIFFPSSRVRGDGKDPCGIPSHEEAARQQQVLYTTLAQACVILGVRCSPASRYGQRVLRTMRTRLKEGFTLTELLCVAQRVRELQRKGDRWLQLRNLLYIWGMGLPPLLADALDSPLPSEEESSPVRREALRRALIDWRLYYKSMGKEIDPRTRPDEWARLVNEKMTEVVRERRSYDPHTSPSGGVSPE